MFLFNAFSVLKRALKMLKMFSNTMLHNPDDLCKHYFIDIGFQARLFLYNSVAQMLSCIQIFRAILI